MRIHEIQADQERPPEVICGQGFAASPKGPSAAQAALPLISKLCQELAAAKINYCHWKSTEAIDRSARGQNDLDLLVARSDAHKYAEVLARLGFREASLEEACRLPGVRDYYGYDELTDRFIHVHTHFQLVLGNDLSKNYRIPLETPYLASAKQRSLFRIPAPEYELAIFIIRMVLKHCTWDAFVMRHSALSPSERREWAQLCTPLNQREVEHVRPELPYIDPALFDACLRALRPDCPAITRIRTGERLQAALSACERQPHARDILVKLWRRALHPLRARLFHWRSSRRPTNGGLLIGIVGGDGSGKSTAIDGLSRWLSRLFDVRSAHLGKPAWSPTTVAVRALLKIGIVGGLRSFPPATQDNTTKFPGYPSLIRSVCTARDRYLAYAKARRFSSNGGLAICDRYPLPGLLDMDAPQCTRAMRHVERPSAFLKWLARLEDGYYRKIVMPDVLVVLRVDPEIAVQRKSDENESSVRARSALVWKIDWSKTSAHVLDASLPKEEVLAQLKALVWGHL